MFWWWFISDMYNRMSKEEQKEFDKEVSSFMWAIVAILVLIFLGFLVYAGYHCLVENIIPNMEHIYR